MRNDHNAVMVYAVGPNCGRLNWHDEGRPERCMTARQFLQVIEDVAFAVMSAVVQYREKAGPTLPTIDRFRVCLISGGGYRHPQSTKTEVARSIIRGLLRDEDASSVGNSLPCLDFFL